MPGRAAAAAVLAVAAAALVAGCPPPDTRAPVPPADRLPDRPRAAAVAPAAVVDAAVADAAPASRSCSSDGDCPAGGVCEGFGCGDGDGVCAPASRPCTRDLASYCGCEGQTFRASGTCPGRRYAYRGACAQPRADGARCAADEQCASGVCEGQGCDDTESGTCAPVGRVCAAEIVAYCGCRGTTFRASAACPGRRFSKLGPCP